MVPNQRDWLGQPTGTCGRFNRDARKELVMNTPDIWLHQIFGITIFQLGT